MNHETTAILKLQGQARRILEVTDTALKGKAIGENVEINFDTAHALNNIAEEVATAVLESIPRPPKQPDPAQELLKALDKARIAYTRRVNNKAEIPVITEINKIAVAYINAATILQYLLDNALDARLDTDSETPPADKLTDTEKESIEFALLQIVNTSDSFGKLLKTE